jgi:hypothetical protein
MQYLWLENSVFSLLSISKVLRYMPKDVADTNIAASLPLDTSKFSHTRRVDDEYES